MNTGVGTRGRPGQQPARALIAVVAGALVTLYTANRYDVYGSVFDYHQPWLAARALIDGLDPFEVVRSSGTFPLIYPLTSVVLSIPFGLMSERWGTAGFTGISVALLAFGLTGRGWWGLILLASIPVISAVQLAQWSPLLTGAALAAGPSVLLGIAIAGKPSVGLSLLAAYPHRRVAIGLASVVLVSLTLAPDWPLRWLSAVRSASGHLEPPVARPWGFLLLLPLIRWKRPEARMVAVLALIPQTRIAYEAVLLLLVPRRAIEAIILVVGSWWTVVAWDVIPLVVQDDLAVQLSYVWPALLIGTYLPMIYLILRRPNE